MAGTALLSSPKVAFSATAGGVDQTGIASTIWTKVNFGTEIYDVGGYFATSRFTPLVAGRYRFSASVYASAGVSAGTRAFVALYKNGALFCYLGSTIASAAADFQINGDADCEANGTTDYFEVFVNLTSASTGTIYGGGTERVTRFQGSLL
jgi:hypothetical protein